MLRQKSVDWRKAQQRAAATAKWATTMTKVRIRRLLARTRWQLVTFAGPNGGESVGIVDLLAIRKAHRHPLNGLKRGDFFEIVLIQIKGGSANFPDFEEIERLRRVGRRYKANAVLLAQWRRGRQVDFFRLKRSSVVEGNARSFWVQVESPELLFR
jgi:hypothetical protein